MFKRRPPKTYLTRIFSGPESLQKLHTLQRDYDAGMPVEASPMFKGLIQLDEGIVLQPVELKGAENLVPRKRGLPGNIALWGHLGGRAIVRAGNPLERRNGIEALPGDMVQITGRGRRSVENPSQEVDSVGLLISVVPLETKLGYELTEQDASMALSALLDQNPEFIPHARVYMDGLDRGTVSPSKVYGFVQRHLGTPTEQNIAG